MKTGQVIRLSPMDRLLYWMHERENIRLKKEANQPKPWTDDEILLRYRFCNVRRMDDKVSQWLLNNWYQPYFNHPNMLVACALARHFNLPTALKAIGFPAKWEPNHIKETLRAMKSRGEKIFNGAYMVRGIGTADKTEMVVDYVCQPLVDSPPSISGYCMQQAVEVLLPYWGFSSFMAGQVIADLRWATTGPWYDCRIWAPLGPGSRRGLNRLEEKPLKTRWCQDAFIVSLKHLIAVCQGELSKTITSRMEAIDYQSCLCEYDKYCRTLFGEGKPKQLYPGNQ